MARVPEYLQVLLNGDPESHAYRHAAERLEREPELQPLLERLAIGEAQWWESALQVLQDSQVEDYTCSAASSVNVEVDATLAAEPQKL